MLGRRRRGRRDRTAGARGRPRPARSTSSRRAPAEVAREDDVHDVLGREALDGRDRVRRSRRGPSTAHLLARSRALQELALQGIEPGSPPCCTPPPGAASTPCRASRGGRAGTGRSSAGAPRRGSGLSDPRIDGPSSRARGAEAATPRSLSGSSSASTSSSCEDFGATTSWAIRMPGSTTNVSRGRCCSSTTRTSPR